MCDFFMRRKVEGRCLARESRLTDVRRFDHYTSISDDAKGIAAVDPVVLDPRVLLRDVAPPRSTPSVRNLLACVEIKILRRVRADSSRRPPRHRRDVCSMAWRCRFLAARPSQVGRVIAEE